MPGLDTVTKALELTGAVLVTLGAAVVVAVVVAGIWNVAGGVGAGMLAAGLISIGWRTLVEMMARENT